MENKKKELVHMNLQKINVLMIDRLGGIKVREIENYEELNKYIESRDINSSKYKCGAVKEKKGLK